MKFLIALLLTGLLSFIAGIYLPWWSITVVSFLVALLMQQSLAKSFLSGFLGVFILWAGLSSWIDISNNHILSARIAQLFSLGSPWLLILLTALIGALVAGFAAMSGGSLLAKSNKAKYKSKKLKFYKSA